ncbi:STY1053 family phage-associated protein [Atlantibacter subterraneus]|uniref:STY1053 family phage-associated protein n=1 Tax=Atlantibacter subterraneus TaxID=255519 RepID=UPI002896AB0D|nr:hypothetical protein [Atlantibacter subterranea]
MSNKTIRVHTPFTFSLEDGTTQRFEAGEHTVDEKTAGHWFVTAHAEVTGNAKSSVDTKEFQAQIDSLTAQLAAKEKAYGELQQSVTEKDETIADLTAQLAAFEAPEQEVKGDTNGKKQKPADSK